MTIRFLCEHCRREVEAPDEAGGKQGKCPFCRQSNYIPAPPAEAEEEIDLAPIDDEEERRRQEEVRSLLEQERQMLIETKDAPSEPLEQKETVEPKDLHHLVVNYCLDMAAGKLQRAGQHAARLRSFGRASAAAVEELASGQVLEPALDSIPPAVLKGFLKELRGQLG